MDETPIFNMAVVLSSVDFFAFLEGCMQSNYLVEVSMGSNAPSLDNLVVVLSAVDLFTFHGGLSAV
jgi:hypothetical protein